MSNIKPVVATAAAAMVLLLLWLYTMSGSDPLPTSPLARFGDHMSGCPKGTICSNDALSPTGPCAGSVNCEYRWDAQCVCNVEVWGPPTPPIAGHGLAKRAGMYCGNCTGPGTGTACQDVLNCETKWDKYGNCAVGMAFEPPPEVYEILGGSSNLTKRRGSVNSRISVGASSLAFGDYEPKWAMHSACYDTCGYDRCNENQRTFQSRYVEWDWAGARFQESTLRCTVTGTHVNWDYRNSYCEALRMGEEATQESYTASAWRDLGGGQVIEYKQTEWKAPAFLSAYKVIGTESGQYTVEPHNVYCWADRGGNWCDAVCSKQSLWLQRVAGLWQPWMTPYIGYIGSVFCPVAC